MKTETTTQPANSSPAKMAFDMYPSISSGKQQDPVREVVMKYIDYFLPDASGTSAVAIDNKIEQAMDLVKSHLMIAVREEVEVLKEKISELMDKINQLEVENTILKANMSQETLQQLQMQTQLQIAGSTPTNGGNMITAPPTPAAITAPPSTTTTAAPTAVAANSNTATAAATPQSNVGSGTATPTTQQPTTVAVAATVEQQQQQQQQQQNVDATQNVTEDNQTSVQTTNGPMS